MEHVRHAPRRYPPPRREIPRRLALGVVVLGCVAQPPPPEPDDLAFPPPALPLDTLTSPAASEALAEAFLAVRPFGDRGWYGPTGDRHTFAPCATPGCVRGGVLSYRFPYGDPLRRFLVARSYVYDNALAMVVHTLRGDLASARSIGQSLQDFTSDDGHLGFSFTLEPVASYDPRYQRAGTEAWAGYALALYEARTHDHRFGATTRRLADTLLAARVASGSDPRHGLIPAGHGTWEGEDPRFNPDGVPTVCVTEHQIDAYFFLATLGAVHPEGPYARAAQDLAARMVDALWMNAEGRFAVAVTEEGPVPGRALDAAGAWGTLFLLARGDTQRARRALDYTLATFATTVDGMRVYAPYAGRVPDHPHQDLSTEVFSEGTAGVGVALARVGRRTEAEALAAALREFQRRGGGGVLYALPRRTDFPDVPSAAATAWIWLLERELSGRAGDFWQVP